MLTHQPDPGKLLILAPTGRDAEGARMLLERENIECRICQNLGGLCDAIAEDDGAALGSEAQVLRKSFIIGDLAAALDRALDGADTADALCRR